MNIWRKIVTFTLILAMPMSSWATVMMNTHCQAADNNSHTEIVQVNDSDAIDLHNQMTLNDTSLSSCGNCDDDMSCSVSICSASAMFDGAVMAMSESSHSDYQRIAFFAYPMDPTLPYRPPITFS